MAEIERTRLREKESPALSNYELALKRAKDTAERNRLGRVVCRLDECPQELTRQGRLRTYLGLNIPDTPLQDWIVFTHEIRTASGKHKHQGGLIIYVIEGAGYSIVDGERIDWEKGDLVLLPLHPNEVEHQHFNLDPEKPSVWCAFIHLPIQEYVASDLQQMENSPDFKG
jgi:hypothetical protein